MSIIATDAVLFVLFWFWGFLEVVIVSEECCNKVSQTEWLQTTEMYHLSVPEVGSPRPRCGQGPTPFGTCRGDSALTPHPYLPGIWQWPSLLGAPWLQPSHPISAWVTIWPSPVCVFMGHVPLIKTPVTMASGPPQ